MEEAAGDLEIGMQYLGVSCGVYGLKGMVVVLTSRSKEWQS